MEPLFQTLTLLDYNIITKYDATGMHKFYDRWPQIAEHSYDMIHDTVEFKDINNVVFIGMGGSGTISDIFSSIMSKSDIHTSVVKGYHLPTRLDADTLLVFTTISGNTTETLSVLEYARNFDSKIISFSSGGKMQTYCERNNILHKKLEFYHSPRASLVSFLYSMLRILEPILKIKSECVSESLQLLKNLQKQINSTVLTDDNPSLNLAEWISGVPMIYYPWGLRASAIRFKNSLQENAKQHAMAEDVIEACHNGIVSWEKPSAVQPILIRGTDDYIKTKEVWEIMHEYFIMKNIDFREITSASGSILSKLICLIYVLDYASIYKAILSSIDPTPINSIDYIKRKLI